MNLNLKITFDLYRKMNDVLKLVEHWIFNQRGGEKVIKTILNKKNKIPLSKLLSISHVFCTDCDLYKPCKDSEWKTVNPELYDSEILCFASLLEECGNSINIDIDESSDIRLQQLYKLIKSV